MEAETGASNAGIMTRRMNECIHGRVDRMSSSAGKLEESGIKREKERKNGAPALMNPNGG